MKVIATLTSNDGRIVYGLAEIVRDFPSSPNSLTWNGKVFLAQPGYGDGAYYAETDVINLPLDAVIPQNHNPAGG